MPEQISSVVAGQYQKLSVVVPVEGTVIVWVRALSPVGSCPSTVPSNAEPLPEWTLAVLALGRTTPPAVHVASPFSKPPFVDERRARRRCHRVGRRGLGARPVGVGRGDRERVGGAVGQAGHYGRDRRGVPVTVVGVWAVDPM